MRAFITGITGQDGSYLAEILQASNYEVFGLLRQSTAPLRERTRYLPKDVQFIDGDVLDPCSLTQAMRISKPDLIFHLAAQSFVGSSWETPSITAQTNALGTLNVLEAMRKEAPFARLYNAASSEMFGHPRKTGNHMGSEQYDENTELAPLSPYAVSKVFAYHMCKVYRESHGLFIVSGIAFNHGSPRRGLQFVERKVTNGVAKIAQKKTKTLRLGNLQSKRDWLHAKDVMRAAYMMLLQDHPRDLVIASGETYSIEFLCQVAFNAVGLKWQDHVVVDSALMRPNDLNYLCGNNAKLIVLDWKPHYTFHGLIDEMVRADLKIEGES